MKKELVEKIVETGIVICPNCGEEEGEVAYKLHEPHKSTNKSLDGCAEIDRLYRFATFKRYYTAFRDLKGEHLPIAYDDYLLRYIFCNKCGKSFEFQFKEDNLVRVIQYLNMSDDLEEEEIYKLVSEGWVKEWDAEDERKK